MFKRTERKIQYFLRKGKKGQHHTYKRKKTLVVFQCDSCHEEFMRDKGLTDDYTHVCPKCDPKRFAQKQGVKQRKKLNLRIDSMIDITSI